VTVKKYPIAMDKIITNTENVCFSYELKKEELKKIRPSIKGLSVDYLSDYHYRSPEFQTIIKYK
jgi:hypothetical protein